MNKPIFSQPFLLEHIPQNHFDTVVGLRKKKDIIQNWADSFATNKIDHFKEEEVKSHFIMEIFGEVLGFNYRNPGVWLSREEVKTKSDATKPDAALGIFRATETGIENDIQVIVEIKGPGADLEKSQNRPGFKLSPVEQAFLYAPKMGGNCKWVVVSNFEEIRFYHHSDIGHYQSFFLKNLLEDDTLRQFLFLFHKDHWTNQTLSVTDKLYQLRNKQRVQYDASSHILDQLYYTLFKFEGLEFIDPNYVANLKPFNVLDDYVWHFRDNKLYTLNNSIYDLLCGITNTGRGFKLEADLEQELKAEGVTDYLKKLRYVFRRLHQFLIWDIVALKAVDLDAIGKNPDEYRKYLSSGFIAGKKNATLKTLEHEVEICDCINCNYRSLDFKSMIKKTKEAKRNDRLTAKELAYSHYQLATDNFKECYDIYRKAEEDSKGVESKNIDYFLAKINLSHLYNLLAGQDDDSADILKHIKQIDLDHSIHQELDVYVDEDVRRYLILIKEFQLFNKIEKKIAGLLEEIRDKKTLFDNRGRYSGPNHLNELNHQYHLLYSHFHKNYLIYDALTDFRQAVTHVFEGLLISYQTRDYGLTKFDVFYLTEAVLYMFPKALQDLLKNVGDLEMEPDEMGTYVGKAESFLNSLVDNYTFGASENNLVKAQLTNYGFKNKFERIFSNLFTILVHLELTEAMASRLVLPIIHFVETEDILAHYDLAQLGEFMERHGRVFKRDQVVDLIKFAVQHLRWGYIKYHSLIASLCKQYALVSPDKPLAEISIIRRAVVSEQDDHGHFNFRDLLGLYPILDDRGQSYFKQEILAALERNFEGYDYELLLQHHILTWDEAGLFTKYAEQTKRQNFRTDPIWDDEHYDLENTVMVNFLAHVHHYGVPLDADILRSFTEQSPFVSWALHPEAYDYHIFDPRWLLALPIAQLMTRLAQISFVKEQLTAYLKDRPDSELAPLYLQYFL